MENRACAKRFSKEIKRMDIVKAQQQHLPDVLDIISSCIKHMESREIYQWDETYPDAEIIKEDIGNGHSYVMKDGGRCIAYVAINDVYEDEVPLFRQVNWSLNGEKTLYIHRLCVHPDYQGRGIAKKMLGFIEDTAAKNGYISIRLEAFGGNETALKMYEKSGYKKVGESYYRSIDLPCYCFDKVL